MANRIFFIFVFLLLSITTVIGQSECLDLPKIAGNPCTGCIPEGYTISNGSPDMVGEDGVYSGWPCELSELSGPSPSGSSMVFMVGNEFGSEAFEIVIDDLEVGQEYAFTLYWEEVVLANCGGGQLPYIGGELTVQIANDIFVFTDAIEWELAEICFIALESSIKIEISIQTNSNGSIVVDYADCEEISPCCDIDINVPSTLIEICPGESVLLDASYEGESGPVTFNWTSDPPDGISFLDNTSILKPTFSFPQNNNFDGFSYEFTLVIEDDSCATKKDIQLVVLPTDIPTFDFEICAGDENFILPDTSLNGYSGIWAGNFDWANLGGTTQEYTFTLDINQNNCIEEWIIPIEILVAENPIFSFPTSIFCELDTETQVLPTTSNNGISGTWEPLNIVPSELGVGNHLFTFTPDFEQLCAFIYEIEFEVKAAVMTEFDLPSVFCRQDSIFDLPLISANGIIGTWSVSSINLNEPQSNIVIEFSAFDGFGCFYPYSHIYSIVPSETPSFSLIHEICSSGDSITLPQTSNEGIQGSWSIPIIDPENMTGDVISIFTPTASQDSCFLQVSDTFTIIPAIEIDFSLPDVLCFSDSILTFPSASIQGIPGTWTTNQFDPSTFVDSVFTNIFITDIQGCSSEYVHKLSVINYTNLEATGTNPTSCMSMNGEIIIMNGIDESIYSIDGGNTWQNDTVFTDLSSGFYTILVQAISLSTCVDTLSISLTSPNAPEIISLEVIDISNCGAADGSISVFASGDNLEYSIDNGANWQLDSQFINLADGNYTVLVNSSSSDCTVSANISINSYPFPIISDLEVINLSDCDSEDGIITIEAFGDELEYSIDNGLNWQSSNTFDNLDSGNYTVLVRPLDTQDCSIDTSIVIVGMDTPFISEVEEIHPSSCTSEDGTLTIIASGSDLEYSIDGGMSWTSTNIFSNLSSGNYSIMVRKEGSTNCLDYFNTILTNPSLPTLTITTSNPSICFPDLGEIIIDSDNSDVEYSIDNGTNWYSSGVFINLPADQYLVQVRNLTNLDCINVDTVNLSLENDFLSLTDTIVVDPTDCISQDGSIIIDVDLSNVEYSIDGGITWQNENIFGDLDTGSYSILVQKIDAPECQEAYFFNISPTPCPCNTIPNVNTLITDVNCQDSISGMIEIEDVTNIIFPDDYEIQWNNGPTGPVYDDLTEGWYSFAINYDLNCVFEDSIFIESAVSIDFGLSSKNASCKEDGIIEINDAIGGSESYMYSLNGVEYQNNNEFTGLSEGDYIVFVRDSEGCEESQEITIEESLILELDLIENHIIDLGETVILDPTIYPANIDSFTWTPSMGILNIGDLLAEVSPKETTEYTITIFLGDCIETKSVTIEVRVDETRLYIPNTFTPDQDGINDVFYPFSDADSNIKILEFRIYDRWGNLVHNAENGQANDPSIGWDGQFNSTDVMQGVYAYYLLYELDGEQVVVVGEVLVLR